MDNGRRAVSGVDVCIERVLIATNAIEEIRVVLRQRNRPFSFRDQFHVPTIEPPTGRVSEDQHALRSVEGRAVIVAFLRMRRPNPLFEYQLFLPSPRITLDRILEGRVLGVRELLVVVKKVLAAQACRRRRMRLHAQSPQGNIDVVDAVVANDTIYVPATEPKKADRKMFVMNLPDCSLPTANRCSTNCGAQMNIEILANKNSKRLIPIRMKPKFHSVFISSSPACTRGVSPLSNEEIKARIATKRKMPATTM